MTNDEDDYDSKFYWLQFLCALKQDHEAFVPRVRLNIDHLISGGLLPSFHPAWQGWVFY